MRGAFFRLFPEGGDKLVAEEFEVFFVPVLESWNVPIGLEIWVEDDTVNGFNPEL